MTSMYEDGQDAQLADAESNARPWFHAVAANRPLRDAFPDELQRRLALTMSEPPTRSWWQTALGAGRGGVVRTAVAAGLAIMVFTTAALLLPRFTPEVDARALLDQIQNAAEVVAAGQVRHVVTTYAMTPDLTPGRSRTLEQWFGNVDGRLVTRETGMMGETTTVDASGAGWILVPENNEVIKTTPGAKGLPIRTPNRVAMESIGADQSQVRVASHSTVNGRAVTTLELTRTLPARSLPQINVERRTDGAQDQVFMFAESDSGAIVVISPQGGTMVSQVVVDDQTRQVLSGHTVSKDPSGAVVGTADWQVTMDQVFPASQAPNGLFSFVIPAGATVREIPPGGPVDIKIEKRLPGGPGAPNR